MPDNQPTRKKINHELPHNSDAERAVLGSALLSKEALYSVLSELEAEAFYEGRHQVIYNALASLQRQPHNSNI